MLVKNTASHVLTFFNFSPRGINELQCPSYNSISMPGRSGSFTCSTAGSDRFSDNARTQKACCLPGSSPRTVVVVTLPTVICDDDACGDHQVAFNRLKTVPKLWGTLPREILYQRYCLIFAAAVQDGQNVLEESELKRQTKEGQMQI